MTPLKFMQKHGYDNKVLIKIGNFIFGIFVEEDYNNVLKLQIDFNSNRLSDFIKLDENYSSTDELINDVKQKLIKFASDINKSLGVEK
jgi:hypothetical protein